MTTVAWDGTTLAADTRCTAGGLAYQSSKAVRLDDGRLYAGSGDAQDMAAVRNWLNSGGDKPTVKDFVGMVIGPDGDIWRIKDKLVLFRVESTWHAIGSGRDYAIAAMHMGLSARQAVELAAIYDVWTGAPVTELQLTEHTQP